MLWFNSHICCSISKLIFFLFISYHFNKVSASFNDPYALNPVLGDDPDRPDLYIGNDAGIKIRDQIENSASPSSTSTLPVATPIFNNQIIHAALHPGDYHLYTLSNISSLPNKTAFIAGNICSVPGSDPYGRNVVVIASTNLNNITNAISSPQEASNLTTVFGFNQGLGSAKVNLTNGGNNDTLFVLVHSNSLKNFVSSIEEQPGPSSQKKRDFIFDFDAFDKEEIKVNDFSVAQPSPESLLKKRTIQPTAANQNDTWQYEIGISIKKSLFDANSTQNIFLIDTDFAHALLTTANMTTPSAENGTIPPYQNDSFYKNPKSYYDLYVFKNEDGEQILETLSNSFCALSTSNKILLNSGNSDISISTRGDIGLPKIQYFVNGLNISSDYMAFITQPRNLSYVVAGNNVSSLASGTAFTLGIKFKTKTERNCQLIYNMTFCKDTAYAAPGNATVYTPQQLAKEYDNHILDLYQGFNYSMQQVPCGNISEFQKYSIMRSCDDCHDSYRKWLCAVTIPRCEDYNMNKTFLATREMNTSRDSFIDEKIRPGPYKEMLPCIDMCYGIVQDCPAQMGFGCPDVDDVGFEGYYMTMVNGSTELSCNFPGAVYKINGGMGHFSIIRLWYVFASILAVLLF